MNRKSTLYRKKFIYTFLIIETAIIGGLIAYIVTYYHGNFQDIINSYLFFSILNLISVLLIYLYDPDPRNIMSKEDFTKIGTRFVYILTIYAIVTLIAFVFPLGLENSNLMPIPGFYGYIVILVGIISLVIFNKTIRKLFDVTVIYIKDALYPNSWPAEQRENDRKYDLELLYQDWLHHASEEENNYYTSLSARSELEARDYAASRMRQIQKEKKEKNKAL